jgi:hypothetical protein
MYGKYCTFNKILVRKRIKHLLPALDPLTIYKPENRLFFANDTTALSINSLELRPDRFKIKTVVYLPKTNRVILK